MFNDNENLKDQELMTTNSPFWNSCATHHGTPSYDYIPRSELVTRDEIYEIVNEILENHNLLTIK